jgi:hypothetical protein
VHDELTVLVALARGDVRINALIRKTCGSTLSLSLLPASADVDGPEGEVEAVVAEFAEQFSHDVSAVSGDSGGLKDLYAEIERYETADGLTAAHKAALRYVDALIWSPARIAPEVTAGVREHFSQTRAVELTLDVMRNTSNEIGVALATDAPRVEHSTERYLIDADGQTVFA